jgi:serine/threonine protein kinase
MFQKPWSRFWNPVEGEKTLSGGQGTVIKVCHQIDGCYGALKEIHPSYLRNAERRQRMAREVLALERMEGQGVPEVLDHNMDRVKELEIPLYTVTRWIEGQTLQQFAGGKPKSIEEALRITRSLAVALARCHEAGVLHRDIKPDNIILDQQEGSPKLVDFGIAWVSPQNDEKTEFRTRIGQELGNRFLRLPDLAAGQRKQDARTDLTFLVGILLFLLTGVAPRVLIDPNGLPPHEALSVRFPESVLTDTRWRQLRRVFQVGFQPSIDQRFQTVTDLVQRIDEILLPGEEEAERADYQGQVEAIQELLESAIAKSIEQIEDALYSTSKNLLQRVGVMASDTGLGVSTGDHIGIGHYVECHFSLHVPRRGISSEVLRHRIELEGSARSFVSASYRFEQEEVVYYRGPAADAERLEEEVLRQADQMFKIVTEDLRQKLESALQ